MKAVLEKLTGGDLRSTGRSDEVVAEVLRRPEWFGDLFDGIMEHDPVVRMRAADAVEKITAVKPDLLAPYCSAVLDQLTEIPQQEVRWHICQLIPRLQLDAAERRRAAEKLKSFLHDKSRIVRTFALQALADLALRDPGLRDEVFRLLEENADCGVPSVAGRSRKLLLKLQKIKSKNP